MSMPLNDVGLPKVVDYQLPPSLADSASSRYVTVAPNGITVTNEVNTPATPFVATSGGPQFPFSQQMIAFDIPAGGGFSTFIDPTQTLLNFSLQWTVVTALTGGTAMTMNIISSLASFISSITLYSNNTPLETINNYDILHNMLLNATLNTSQRYANAFQFGADSNTFTGIDLPITGVANATYTFNCSLPLISIIGVNGGDKLFPIGLIQNLQLQVTTNQWMPISTYCTAIPAPQPLFKVKLDNWGLTLKYIDLGEIASSLLQQTIKDGKIHLKASSYVNSNTTITSGTSGSQSLILQLRNSSVKSVFSSIGSNALPLQCPNFLYDSINPSITSLQLSNPAVGFRIPNKPLNPCQRPAETFASFSQAFGSGPASSYGGIVGCETFHNIYPALLANSDWRWIYPAAALRASYLGNDNIAYANICKFPNMFYMGFDCEKCQTSLFSGINTRSAPPQYDMTIATTLTTNLQMTTFALIDVVCCFNIQTKDVVVYN
jgi:hypothetical protein